MALLLFASSGCGCLVTPGLGTDGSKGRGSRRGGSRRRRPRTHTCEVFNAAVADRDAQLRPAQRRVRVVVADGACGAAGVAGAGATVVCAGTVLIVVEAVLLVLVLVQSPEPPPIIGHTAFAATHSSAAEVLFGPNRQKRRSARLHHILRPRGNGTAGDIPRDVPE